MLLICLNQPLVSLSFVGSWLCRVEFLFRCTTSLIVAHGFSCSVAYGVLVPQQVSNPHPLHYKVNS